MNARRLASMLQYPPVWLEHGLLSGELLATQLGQVRAQYGSGQPSGGTEHWRYGAFLFWFQRELHEQTLGHLLEAAVADPDPPMAGNILKLVASHPKCTLAMLQTAVTCAATSPDYYASAQELEALFNKRFG